MSSDRLEIRNLSIQFSMSRPVRDVELSVSRGTAVGIVGESGSGKSLTAMAIMGLLPAQAKVSGEILWNGRNLLHENALDMRELRGRDIAMIFQDPMSSLNPSFTIGFQIDEVLRFRLGMRDARARRERGIQLLNEVGISSPEERWSAFPHSLSGGMSQRVCIAMALAGEPKLLIADEPTTALDVTIQFQILDLLAQLKKQRSMSLLFVTHDLAVAAKICDQISVFYAGRTVEGNLTRGLFAHPRHPYTEALIGARPNPSQLARTRLRFIGGSVPRSTDKISGCIFASRCEKVFDRCRGEVPPRYGVSGRNGTPDIAFASCFLADDLK